MPLLAGHASRPEMMPCGGRSSRTSRSCSVFLFLPRRVAVASSFQQTLKSRHSSAQASASAGIPDTEQSPRHAAPFLASSANQIAEQSGVSAGERR